MTAIYLKGFDKLREKLGRDIRPALEAIRKGVALELVDLLKPYPPSASQPGRVSRVTQEPMGWYERGRGWWYPVMQKTTLGPKLGKARGAIRGGRVGRAAGVAGYKLIASSERLREHWTITERGVQTIVGNPVSYSAVVQSAKKQSKLMKAIGWKTDLQAIQELIASGDIQRIASMAIRNLLK